MYTEYGFGMSIFTLPSALGVRKARHIPLSRMSPWNCRGDAPSRQGATPNRQSTLSRLV